MRIFPGGAPYPAAEDARCEVAHSLRRPSAAVYLASASFHREPAYLRFMSHLTSKKDPLPAFARRGIRHVQFMHTHRTCEWWIAVARYGGFEAT